MHAIDIAATVEAAEASFGEFAECWRERCPAMIRSWEMSWKEFVPFLELFYGERINNR